MTDKPKKDKAKKKTDGQRAAGKLRQQIYRHRLQKKKDRNVFKSSHGKFQNVAELEAHRRKQEGKKSLLEDVADAMETIMWKITTTKEEQSGWALFSTPDIMEPTDADSNP
jgi:hypothetical protein